MAGEGNEVRDSRSNGVESARNSLTYVHVRQNMLFLQYIDLLQSLRGGERLGVPICSRYGGHRVVSVQGQVASARDGDDHRVKANFGL